MRIALVLYVLLPGLLKAQDSTRIFFSCNKEVSYNIHYGFIEAGTLTCHSDTTLHLIEGKKCHKMTVIGKTSGAAAAFAKINDKWITYVDALSGLPFRFIRELQENKYEKEELTEFDRQNNIAIVSTKSSDDEYNIKAHKITADAHDMVSAYLALNATPLHTFSLGDTTQMNIFLEDSTYNFKIKYLGKEVINTRYGKKEAFKLAPLMPENSVFSKEEDLICWISADKEKIPLKLRAKVAIGAIEMELMKYSGYK